MTLQEISMVDFQVQIADLYKGVSKVLPLLSSAEAVTNESTPHDVVFQVDNVRLLRYKSNTKSKYKIPVLIVYAFINRPYILDLENKSMIKNLVDNGFDIYLLDWGTPDVKERSMTMSDYLSTYLDKCVDVVREISESRKITLFGFCMGGTLSTIYTTMHMEKVKNLITLAPPIDCSKDTTVFAAISKFLDADRIVDTLGNIPPFIQYQFFMMLKPFKHFVGRYYEISQRTTDGDYMKDALRLEKWLWDTAPLPGEVFRQWIKDLYQKNLLVHNRLRIGQTTIDLQKIDIPLLNIIAEFDHLVSPDSSLALNHLVSSKDNTPMTFPAGHIGLCASTYAQKEVWPKITQWLGVRSK